MVDKPSEFPIPIGVFGEVDIRLPTAIGTIVMLAALLEHKVAAIAASVDDKPQNFYFSSLFRDNKKICQLRLPLFDGSAAASEAAMFCLDFVKLVDEVLKRRNELVHRVWARAAGDSWGGHKGERTNRSGQQRAKEHKAVSPSEWSDYSLTDFSALIERMVGLVEESTDAIARACSLPRKSAEST